MAFSTVLVGLSMALVIFIMVNGLKVKLMDKVFISQSIQAHFMMELGTTTNSMDLEKNLTNLVGSDMWEILN